MFPMRVSGDFSKKCNYLFDLTSFSIALQLFRFVLILTQGASRPAPCHREPEARLKVQAGGSTSEVVASGQQTGGRPRGPGVSLREASRKPLQQVYKGRAGFIERGRCLQWALRPSKPEIRASSPGNVESEPAVPHQIAIGSPAASLNPSPAPPPITGKLSACLPLV